MSIHYAEEQNFLSNYIFTKRKIVDNVWIGARYAGDKLYKWEDHSTVQGYSNWASGNPKNLTDHCVEMLADESLQGKWADERCERRNVVLCQRMPVISLRLLAETMVELKHALQHTVTELAETKKEFAQLKKETITLPLGFIYVQLPKDKGSGELWPRVMTWTDVSAEYEGVFFCVAGRNAASFGKVQEYNAPRLEMVHSSYDNADVINKVLGDPPLNMTIPVTGWSEAIYTGRNGGANRYFMNFKHSNIAEVRPKNMAVKVYKRTA